MKTSDFTKTSSMRLALLSVIALTALLVITLTIYVTVTSLKEGKIDWNGMALFLGSIAVFMTPAFTGKAIQKKHEVNEQQTAKK